MIADSVAFCPAEGKRVIYDAEHFFDGWRDDPGYALECLQAAVAGRGRERHALRHERLQPPDQVAEATAAVVAALGERAEVGIHTHNDAECGVANSLAAVEAGRAAGPGHDQRLRRALRQRQPGLDPARAAAQARLRVRPGRAAAAAHRDRPPHRRALQPLRPTPTSPTSAATPSPTRAACTRPGSRPTPAPSSTWSRSPSATAARC